MSASSRPLAARIIISVLALAACAKTVPVPGGLGDPCLVNTDCATGFVCGGGICALPANLGGCSPGRTRCNGDDVEKCAAGGETWELVSTCATGCIAGGCAPQVCTPNTLRCEGDASEECTPSGNAWAFVQECQSHCTAATGLCKAPICTPFATTCSADGLSVLTCDSFGAAQASVACAGGQTCSNGQCQTVVCSAGAVRCASGNASTEICNAAGNGWGAGQSCPYNCGGSPGSAACLAPACTAGDTRCSPSSPSALEQCLPGETGWAFENFCSTGCAASDAHTAACNPLVCAPLARRCESDALHVDTCSPLGTEWNLTDTCPQGCLAGQCITNSAGCTPGELRCNGLDTQSCANVPDAPGVTAWNTSGTCLSGCVSGACLPGGSCAAFTLEVGAPLSDAGIPTAPGDGVSTVLVYSDPIHGTDGSLLPDGTLFTVSATQVSGAIGRGAISLVLPTADADPVTPGTQVASSAGRIRFSVPASALGAGAKATVAVTAQLAEGGSCATSSSFVLDQTLTGTSVLVAEDFSTTTFRDPVSTTANWSTTQQMLGGAWPDAIGNGGDGNLAVTTSNSPYNLATSGYAPSFAVLGLAAQSAVVDGPAQGLSGGDEVILWDAQGSASGAGNAGVYEMLTIQSVIGSTVTFTTSVQNSYGAAADQDVAAQHVVLQRVPHFATLSVTSGSTLTTSAWDGTRGGLIFLRATRIILGGAPTGTNPALIDVSGLGFRGGIGGAAPSAGEDATGLAGFDAPGGGAGAAGVPGSGGSYGTLGSGASPGGIYGTRLLGKLFLGAGGGGTSSGNAGAAGGGAAVIFAGQIDFTSNGVTVGQVRANGVSGSSSGSGAGGTIWIGAPSMTAGPGTSPGTAPLAFAQGGTSGTPGGAGRVRVDAESLDSPGFGAGVSCSRATPSCAFGQLGAVQGQSLAAFTVSGGESIVNQAALLLALDAPASATFAASASGSSGFGTVSLSAPLTFTPTGASPVGPTFRWRAQLAPDATHGVSAVRGLQWQLQVK